MKMVPRTMLALILSLTLERIDAHQVCWTFRCHQLSERQVLENNFLRCTYQNSMRVMDCVAFMVQTTKKNYMLIDVLSSTDQPLCNHHFLHCLGYMQQFGRSNIGIGLLVCPLKNHNQCFGSIVNSTQHFTMHVCRGSKQTKISNDLPFGFLQHTRIWGIWAYRFVCRFCCGMCQLTKFWPPFSPSFLLSPPSPSPCRAFFCPKPPHFGLQNNFCCHRKYNSLRGWEEAGAVRYTKNECRDLHVKTTNMYNKILVTHLLNVCLDVMSLKNFYLFDFASPFLPDQQRTFPKEFFL